MLEHFKNFDVNRMSIEQLVSLAAYGRQLRDEYEHLQLEEPDWVDVQLKALRREIASKNADHLEALLREKKSRLEALKTPGEKRATIEKEIVGLQKQLAKV